MRTIILATALALVATTALPQQRSFYDRNGRFAGTAIDNRNRTQSFYDKNGSFAGSSIHNSDGTTSFFDARGRFTGSVVNTSKR
jgi:hypothetical protein